MNGKDARPSSSTRKDSRSGVCAPSRAGDVVVNVVAESLRRKVSSGKSDGGRRLAGKVMLSPPLPGHYRSGSGCRMRIPRPNGRCLMRPEGFLLAPGDGPTPTAAPHQARRPRKFNVCGDTLDDLPGQLPPALVGKTSRACGLHATPARHPTAPRPRAAPARCCRPAQGQLVI